MENTNKLNKEIRESELERKNMEFRIESYKKSIIRDLKTGMGNQIKEIGSKPEKVKIPFITKLKRWIRKKLI